MDPALLLSLLCAAGFVAAFIDSIVGGGGVISLPALLAAGLPPHLALGTNKLAATGASSMAAARWTQAGTVRPRLAVGLIPFSVLGSLLGALAVLQLEAHFVRLLVLLVMAAMTIYVLVRPAFGRDDRSGPTTRRGFVALVALALGVGFYDGFLGPGTGSFLIFGFVALARFDFLRAAGHARVLNFASNASALALFGLSGSINYRLGLPMMAAMVAGAYVGSHFGLRHGTRWVKPLFVAISLLLMGRLLWAVFVPAPQP